MLFSEPAFLFYFLPAVLLLHTALPTPARNPLLLFASVLFYAWGEPVHVLILLSSIAFNAWIGPNVAGRDAAAARWLALGVAGNLAVLGWFKYAGFVSGVFGLGIHAPELPIGISFFTFQAISFLVDVYRGEADPPRSAMRVGLYIALFPQLIAGPIVRYRDVAAQLERRSVTLDGLADGARRFTIGLAKKMLIANTLAVPADHIFSLPESELTTGLSWLGVACYSFQIYFDFSGYSDMAIGLGRMFGLRFHENFAYPYESASIREFWRRWHISLSTWFRDYVYIPLGGGRRGAARVAVNLWCVFLLCGLWHGASWNFLLWGAFHGSFLALERVTGFAPRGATGRIYALAVVAFGWVLFRAESLPQTRGWWQAMLGFGASGSEGELAWLLDARVGLALSAAVIGCTSAPTRAARWLAERAARSSVLVDASWRFTEVASLMAALVACAALMASGAYDPFIYFRF